jgi:inner membrane protein
MRTTILFKDGSSLQCSLSFTGTYVYPIRMPTIITHTAVPIALGLGLGKDVVSRRLMTAGAVAAMLPDIDVIAFYFGFPYGSAFTHRGFTHSLSFAALCALLGACACRPLNTRFACAFWFLFVSMASHGVLDTFTDGGSGIAFLWPFSNARFFAPAQFIEVSPIGVTRFLSERGVTVLLSELKWVWLPCLLVAAGLVFARRINARN